MKYEKIKFEIRKYKLPKASSQKLKKTPKKVMLQASVVKLTQTSFLITIIDICFKNINHSFFSLHTFSIAEKVCKKARQ